jgi:hypothetical protein
MLPLAASSISNIYHQPQIVEQHSHFHTTHIPKMCLVFHDLEKIVFSENEKLHTKKSNLVTTISTSLLLCCGCLVSSSI